MAEFVQDKTGNNRTRSEQAVMDKTFDSIYNLELIKTRPKHFLEALQKGTIFDQYTAWFKRLFLCELDVNNLFE